jgi:DNA-binding HxlR family transcriptional regulator
MAERLRRGYVFAQDCPSREVLNHITSRWAILVLVALKAGTHRFSALRRKISGVSEKMLAQTLQTLEADGFVHRLAYPVVPPKVEYQLTALGEALAVRLEDLADWIETHIDDIVAQRAAVAAVPTPRHASESVDAL